MKDYSWQDVYLWGLAALFAVALSLTLVYNRPSREDSACRDNQERTEAGVVINYNLMQHTHACYLG